MIRPLFVLITFLVSLPSMAATTLINQRPLLGGGTGVVLNAAFVAYTDHPELGRAWIEFSADELPSPGDDGAHNVFNVRVRLNGLAYNAADRTITLSISGQRPLVCARLNSTMFGTRVQATDDCRLSTRIGRQRRDDGFEVREVPVAQLYLTTPDLR